MTPRERWQKLVKASIVEINAIDADTEWKEYEQLTAPLYADDNQRRRVWSRAKAFAASPINEITVKQGEAEARLIVRQLEARGVAAEAVERAGKWIVRKKGGSENG